MITETLLELRYITLLIKTNIKSTVAFITETRFTIYLQN